MTTRIAKIIFPLALLCLWFAPGALHADDSAPRLGAAANYLFETSDLMKQIAHGRWLVPPTNWQTLSGALGQNAAWETNKTLPWYIEHQKDGRDYISAGLAVGNKDLVRWGLKILEWG